LQYSVVYIAISPPSVTTSAVVNVVIMNAESGDNQAAKPVGPKGRKDRRLLTCFSCGILGHVKAGCPVRIYRLERAEKRAREGRDKEKNTLPDIEAMTVARKHLFEELAKSTEMLSQELERWCSGKAMSARIAV
jgi:hypothetical protein